jgi:hypothetical protein
MILIYREGIPSKKEDSDRQYRGEKNSWTPQNSDPESKFKPPRPRHGEKKHRYIGPVGEL